MIEDDKTVDRTGTKVVVIVEGGMVSNVYAGGADIDLVVIDKDTDTETEDDQDDLAGLIKIY